MPSSGRSLRQGATTVGVVTPYHGMKRFSVAALAPIFLTMSAATVTPGSPSDSPFPVATVEHVTRASGDIAASPVSQQLAAVAGSSAPITVTGRTGAFVISAVVDNTITDNPNAAAIEATIVDAVEV